METILEQLKDPLLPVRAHALMDLRRLVLAKVRSHRMMGVNKWGFALSCATPSVSPPSVCFSPLLFSI